MSFETLAKKQARCLTWFEVVRGLGERFWRSRIVYLAGPDGGDASTLEGLHHSPELQLAVDSDPVALASFSAKHPNVETFHGSIADLPEDHFNVVFLDTTYRVDNHRELPASLRHGFRCLARRDDSYLICAVTYGREARDNFIQIAADTKRIEKGFRQESRRSLQSGLQAQMLHELEDAEYVQIRGKTVRADELREAITKLSPAELVDTAMLTPDADHTFGTLSRIAYGLVAPLNPVIIERRLLPRTAFAITYRGETKRAPMLIHGWRTLAKSSKWTADKFVKWREREEARPCWSGEVQRVGRPTVYDLLALVEDAGLRDEAPRLLNMTPGSVAAYRASRTRGERD